MTFPILVLVTECQLDLCCVAVNVQLYAGNEARIIGCQKERSSRNLGRLAYSTHWDYRGEAVLHFLRSVSNISISTNVDVERIIKALLGNEAKQLAELANAGTQTSNLVMI